MLLLSVIIFKIFFLVFLLSNLIAAENCELITLKEQSSASCQPFSDCSGLFCADTKNTSHVRFTVDNCEDPVLVNATFHHFETVNHVFNGSSTISLELEEEVSWNMSRNASHLFVQVITSVLYYFDNELY